MIQKDRRNYLGMLNLIMGRLARARPLKLPQLPVVEVQHEDCQEDQRDKKCPLTFPVRKSLRHDWGF